MRRNFLLLLSTFILAAFTSQDSKVTITIDNSYRYIKSNGLPNHQTGQFPNRDNPNTISEQSYSFKVPLNPQLSGKTTTLEFANFGVALNGVVFDPNAAEFWNNDRNSGWNYNPNSSHSNQLGIDSSNAHVQPNGAYHYHGIPYGMISKQGGNPHSKLIGYAADGFPIYAIYGYEKDAVKKLIPSYRLKSGNRPSGPGGQYDGTFVEDYEYVQGLGDLDECNGRTAVTPEYPKGTYYYVLTEKFPYVPRCWKGTPDPSFSKRGGMGGRGKQGTQGMSGQSGGFGMRRQDQGNMMPGGMMRNQGGMRRGFDHPPPPPRWQDQQGANMMDGPPHDHSDSDEEAQESE